MTKTERKRVEAFLRDLARVCVAHGPFGEVKIRCPFPGVDLIQADAQGYTTAFLEDGEVIELRVDASPPPF